MANNEFRDIVRNVLKAKDSDYSGGKQFGNFEFVESAGYSRIDGVIIRLGDKIGRLVNMSDKAAVNESVIDTVIDGAGYSVVGLFRGKLFFIRIIYRISFIDIGFESIDCSTHQ